MMALRSTPPRSRWRHCTGARAAGLLLAGLILCCGNASAQEYGEADRALRKAASYFDKGSFGKALELYLEVYTREMDADPVIQYNIGVCYINTVAGRQKAIPYLERALASGDKRIPPETMMYLGDLYHVRYEFDRALELYGKCLDDGRAEESLRGDLAGRMAMTRTAMRLMEDSIQVGIRNLGLVVNSPWSEHSPVISADENILIFTATERLALSIQDPSGKSELSERIYISYKRDSAWTIPRLLAFEGDSKDNFGSVGLYPDGQKLMIYRGSKHSGNIYICYAQSDSTWSVPEKATYISSKFWEGSASVTPDEKTIYFSSTRPGGYGGKDIYQVIRQYDGTWSSPINLGPMINTELDEDAPFIHPDQKTLYFSSKGSRSMGGYDIFRAKKLDIEWSAPVNLGYPINSTGDDIYFVLSADGRKGYFASDRLEGMGDLDIYSMDIPSESIPLTMVRGKVMAGSPPQPVRTKIKVVDKETSEKIRYVYNPNPKTGKYLMIFPPGKNYDMVVEADGYTPRVLNIYVPQQTYFYELYQEIYLHAIRVGGASRSDTAIGEAISVKNIFYDVRQHLPDSSKKIYTTYEKDYEPLLQLIEKLIETTDSSKMQNLEREMEELAEDTASVLNLQETSYSPLLALVEQIIKTTDTIAQRNIDAIAGADTLENRFYYGSGEGLVPYYFGTDTIYAPPPIETWVRPDAGGRESTEGSAEPPAAERIVKNYTLFYKTASADPDPAYGDGLSEISRMLLGDIKLYVVLEGHTDDMGSETANAALSRRRASVIAGRLISSGVDKRRISTEWFGKKRPLAGNDTEEGRRQNRRVEIRIIERTGGAGG